MKLIFILPFLLWASAVYASDLTWKNYPYQDPASSIRFPDDEGHHTMFPNMEWWYTVIHATSVESGEHYSILITHFNNRMRFFTVTNIEKKLHLSSTEIGTLDSRSDYLDIKHKTKFGTDIYRSRKDNFNHLIPFEYEIKSYDERVSVDVAMKSLKKPLMIKGDGDIQIGSSGRSWYYSLTRLEVSGVIVIDGKKENITGTAWMDHQWGPFLVSPISIGSMFESYEWFCLQLDNGSDLMISNIFDRDFNLPLGEDYGDIEIMDINGSSKHTIKRKFTRTGFWKDPVSGHIMSMGWRLEVPEWEVDLILTPSFLDQMVKLPLNGDFWEGSIEVKGTVKGQTVIGKSFGELIHRYEIPKIEITKLNKSELNWVVKNPDAGNPLTYQVELIQNNKVQVLAKDLKETYFRFPKFKSEKNNIRVIGTSIDGTIQNSASVIYLHSPSL